MLNLHSRRRLIGEFGVGKRYGLHDNFVAKVYLGIWVATVQGFEPDQRRGTPGPEPNTSRPLLYAFDWNVFVHWNLGKNPNGRFLIA